MRSILNTMPSELPFENQRKGGYGNVNIAPVADKGKLLPFIMPKTDAQAIDSEWIVQIDRWGKEVKRTVVANFLEVKTIDSRTMFMNNMQNDIYDILSDTLPCGYYYYLISAGGKSYKTDIFQIDNTIDAMGAPGEPQLPIVPKILGDYNSDYSDDYYNKTQ